MGAANAFFTAEAVEEGIDLLDEAGGDFDCGFWVGTRQLLRACGSYHS